MTPQLLPAFAAAFAPRASSVNIVLGSTVEEWLTQTLKRINRIKRPLNSVPQHQRCLTETLSSKNAIWALTSIMLSRAPNVDLRKDSNPFIQTRFGYQFLHIEAYIVYVDMILENEVAFKLTPDSIESLIGYHKDIYCVDIATNTYNWQEKELQVKKLHEEFIQAINKFVYRTHAKALEGLEEDGAGELLCGKSDEVKNDIMSLFLPLLPPSRIMDVVQPHTLPPSSTQRSLEPGCSFIPVQSAFHAYPGRGNWTYYGTDDTIGPAVVTHPFEQYVETGSAASAFARLTKSS